MNTELNKSIVLSHEMADRVTKLLRLIDHPERMLILCNLSSGEKCVSELIRLSYLSQSAFSQHLAILRDANLVKVNRVAQTLYYSINDPSILLLLATLKNMFCQEEGTSNV